MPRNRWDRRLNRILAGIEICGHVAGLRVINKHLLAMSTAPRHIQLGHNFMNILENEVVPGKYI
jgi:hypothetical protein